MSGDQLNIASVMQVVSWISLLIGLVATLMSLNRTGKKDQIALENRLTKIESTLENINQAIVGGQMVARMNDIDNRLKTIEERGCKHAHQCAKEN